MLAHRTDNAKDRTTLLYVEIRHDLFRSFKSHESKSDPPPRSHNAQPHFFRCCVHWYLAKLSIQSLIGSFTPVRAPPQREQFLQQRHDPTVRMLHAQLKPQRVEDATFRDKNLRGGGGATEHSIIAAFKVSPFWHTNGWSKRFSPETRLQGRTRLQQSITGGWRGKCSLKTIPIGTIPNRI